MTCQYLTSGQQKEILKSSFTHGGGCLAGYSLILIVHDDDPSCCIFLHSLWVKLRQQTVITASKRKLWHCSMNRKVWKKKTAQGECDVHWRIRIPALLWCRGSLSEITWQWGNCALQGREMIKTTIGFSAEWTCHFMFLAPTANDVTAVILVSVPYVQQQVGAVGVRPVSRLRAEHCLILHPLTGSVEVQLSNTTNNTLSGKTYVCLQ